jgi:OmpA-OmpF porin, OOP family
MTKRSIVALFSAAAIALPTSALSEQPERGWYIGAELGQASFADEDDTAFKLLGGYRINRNLSAEGGYAWLFDKNGAEVTAFELVALAAFPLATQLSILGKLGLANVYAEGPTIDEEKVQLTYGLGVQYDVTRRIGVRGQWQRYDSEEEVDLFSIGVLWRF